MDHNDHLSQDKKELDMESNDFVQPLSAKHFKFSGLKIVAIVLVGLAIIVIILILNFSKLSVNNAIVKTTKKLPTSQVSTSVSKNNLEWILQYHFLALVEKNSKALNEFKNSKIYVVLSNKELASSTILANPDHLNLIPTDYINNSQKFMQQYSSHDIKYPIQAVLFDDSSDTPTSVVPTNQAQNPLKYDQLLSNFSRQHNLTSICDYILAKRTANKKPLASPCQITAMNYSQQSERNSASYFKIVNQAVQVIHRQYPNQMIFAGLSTNPRGSVITVAELVNAVKATNRIVSGYWISIPTSGGVGCPQCSKQNASLLSQFLANLNQVSVK